MTTNNITMIERVARALCEAEGMEWGAQASAMTSGSGGDNEQEYYLTQARAAIEAMREPTEAMQDAGESHCNDYGTPSGCFRAMIDAALTN